MIFSFVESILKESDIKEPVQRACKTCTPAGLSTTKLYMYVHVHEHHRTQLMYTLTCKMFTSTTQLFQQTRYIFYTIQYTYYNVT